MASGDTVDGIIEIEDTSRRHTDGKHEQFDDENDEEEKEKEMARGKAPSPLDMTGASNQAGGGPKTPPGITRHRSERERKLGHRRVGVGGEITYKKIQTSQIMGSIQLGIQHAVGGLASKPERDLLMQDFMTVETTNFDAEGSNHTPAHHYSDFKFKTYAPIAFRYFRDLFGIQPDDFLISMCSAPLRELSNPGASGSIFYLTADDEFIIKTVQHKEGEFLQKLLPGYYMNLNQNPRTLLPKFFGLYCYQCNSKNVRLVAMNNLLPSFIKLHQKYDLKGSTYKRKASKLERTKNSPTYKDLDFIDHHPEGIFLEADTYSALVKTIQRDCRVLESFKIMDYSLLVGIHNLDQAAREKAERRTQERQGGERGEGSAGEGGSGAAAVESGDDRGSVGGGGQAGALNRSRSINRQRLVAHSTAMESIQAESEPIDEEEDVPPGGIPARNAKGERLLMFLGVIDILQSYRLKKKLEHTWKSMIHDGDTVSVHRPGFYAQRFQDFMAKTVFKKIPSLDLPEIKGNHRKFRTLVTSYIALKDMLALKHSPSKRRSISKGGGGRLGSLPCGGLQDADTAAPSSNEEEGGLVQSPHHATATATAAAVAAAGSKPGSPTAAQQAIGFATSKVTGAAASAGGMGPSALSQAPHSSPPTTSSPVLPQSSSPPSATVHYPAVLKGRSVGIGMAGSPAGSSSSTPGKPRIPPPVPPRSPKRPHHGQQSVRQGPRGMHRPRAEEERGGALVGSGALRDTLARTSDLLYPSKHCSSASTENAPPTHSSPTTKAMTDNPNCPPRRNRACALSEGCSVSGYLMKTSQEGISPVVPPRRFHKVIKNSDALSRGLCTDKMELHDQGDTSDELNVADLHPQSPVSASKNVSTSSTPIHKKLGDSELTCVDKEKKILSESRETSNLRNEYSGDNGFQQDKLSSLDGTRQSFKEEVSSETRSLVGKIDINTNNSKSKTESRNRLECNDNTTDDIETDVESDESVDSKGSEGKECHGIETGITLSAEEEEVKEETFSGKEANEKEDAVDGVPHVLHIFSNSTAEEESFSRSSQVSPTVMTGDSGEELLRQERQDSNLPLVQFQEYLTEKNSKNCRSDFNKKPEPFRRIQNESSLKGDDLQELEEEHYTASYEAGKVATWCGEEYDEQLSPCKGNKIEQSEGSSMFKVCQPGQGILNSGFHRAEQIVFDYSENDKPSKCKSDEASEHLSEAPDIDGAHAITITSLNHSSSKICDKSAQLKPEDRRPSGIPTAHVSTPVALAGGGGGCGTNGENSKIKIPITTSKLHLGTAFDMQLMNNYNAKEMYGLHSPSFTFSHSNTLPKPFSRAEIHGFGKDQSFRSVLPPSSSPNCTASHIPSVVNGYVDLEDVI